MTVSDEKLTDGYDLQGSRTWTFNWEFFHPLTGDPPDQLDGMTFIRVALDADGLRCYSKWFSSDNKRNQESESQESGE